MTALCLNLVMLLQVNGAGTTFTDCYNSYYSSLTTKLTNSKFAGIPEASEYVTNLCNFYHEKTGQWFTDQDWGTSNYSYLINKYYPEFQEKYIN